jgi:hypothetical protein
MESPLLQALREVSEQLSMIIAMLVCIAFAIIRWKRHPAVSGTVLAGCLLLLLQVFVVAAIYAWVPEAIIKSVNPADVASFRQNVYMIIALCSNSMVAFAFALLVAGIFMKRTPTP